MILETQADTKDGNQQIKQNTSSEQKYIRIWKIVTTKFLRTSMCTKKFGVRTQRRLFMVQENERKMIMTTKTIKDVVLFAIPA
jgi:hypothetical protein